MRVPAIPYKGSKAKIALDLIDMMPPAHTFYDIFAGGGAMTSAALMSHKYRRIVMNDKEPGLTRLYLDILTGNRTIDMTEWVSREDFFKRKDNDPLIRFIWSFGNNGRDYLYSTEIEPYKRAIHFAVCFNDYAPLKELGIDMPRLTATTITERRLEMKRAIRAMQHTKAIKEIGNVRVLIDGSHSERQSLLQQLRGGGQILPQLELAQHLQQTERLRDLRQLAKYIGCCTRNVCNCFSSYVGGQNPQQLEISERNYKDVEVDTDNCIIYADPPYVGTNRYSNKEAFNHEEFYEWVRHSPHVIFISEYSMPKDFVCIKAMKHSQTLCATKNSFAIERLFVHESKIDRIPKTTLF